MARPLTLVFQEFAEITANVSIPDLETIIVGPAYHIRDYADDKSAIGDPINVGEFGELNSFTAPDEAVIAEPPDNAIGAILDAESVGIYFDDARVAVTDDVTGIGTDLHRESAPNENIFRDDNADFSAAEVAVGDLLVIEHPTEGLLVLTVQGAPGVAGSTLLDTQLEVTANFPSAWTTPFAAGTKYRVERVVNDELIDSQYVTVSDQEVTVSANVTIDLSATALDRPVTYAVMYMEYRSLRQDLALVTDLNANDVDATNNEIVGLGRIDSRNPLAAAVYVALQNTTTGIKAFGLKTDNNAGYLNFLSVVAHREDIYAIVPLTTDVTILATLKNSVEALADPTNALANGVPQKFRVVIGSLELPELKNVITPQNDGVAETAASDADVSTLDFTGASLASDLLALVITPGYKVEISDHGGVGVDGEYVVSHVNTAQILEVDEDLSVLQGDEAGAHIINFTGSPGFITNGVLAGAALTIAGAGTPVLNAVHTITAVLSETSLAINTDIAAAIGGIGAGTYDAGGLVLGDFSVDAATVPQPVFELLQASGAALLPPVTGNVSDLVVTANDGLYNVLLDDNGTFISSNVNPGDTLEITADPNSPASPASSDFETSPQVFTVESVLSENRIKLRVTTRNTSNTVNELPHGVKRSGGVLVDNATPNAINYRIVRNLSTDDQVDEMVATAQSFNSQRVVLVYPDWVKVAGLVDGSKPRTEAGELQLADPQLGYYLSAVVGGMIAGLPPHQCFTFLGVAGIEEIQNSDKIFNDEQLTQLSEGGVYVFVQPTLNELPYTIHELTTDPSSLETGELMVVKNFDFVSLFFKDILDEFLGIWNINDETLAFMRQSLETGIETLRLQRTARIGAPINNAQITSLARSATAADRVETYIEVDLPRPLNINGLHLIA